MRFCGKCDNYLSSIKDIGGKPYWVCTKVNCDHTEPVDTTKPIHRRPDATDRFAIYEGNKFLGFDKTAPRESKNVTCGNPECKDKNAFLRYFKYNTESVEYLYACTGCGIVTKNPVRG